MIVYSCFLMVSFFYDKIIDIFLATCLVMFYATSSKI